VAEAHSARDDVSAHLSWRSVDAKLKAAASPAQGAELASKAVALADATDRLNQRAKARVDLGEVLRVAGRDREAEFAFEEARRLFQSRGNTVGAATARARLAGVPV
jgi:hypothetical protein